MQNHADLAETIPWFRIHQGGLYDRDDFIHGILLLNDENGGLDHFHNRIIITRLARQTSGKRSTLPAFAKAALNTLDGQAMIGVVIAKEFQKLPVTFRGDEKYGIAGFWHLSNVFAVRTKGPKGSAIHIDLMARLTDSGPRDSIWWNVAHDETIENAVKVFEDGDAFEEIFRKDNCSTCKRSSAIIFQEGWVCTNITCEALSKDHLGHPMRTSNYLDQFLGPWVSQQQLDQI